MIKSLFSNIAVYLVVGVGVAITTWLLLLPSKAIVIVAVTVGVSLIGSAIGLALRGLREGGEDDKQ